MQRQRYSRATKLVCFVCVLVALTETFVFAQNARVIGTSVKHLDSCEIDLNGDRRSDLVLALGTRRGGEVLALLATRDGYDAFVLSTGYEQIELRCQTGNSVAETKSGGGKGRTFNAPGAFVVVSQPEGPKAAYVWNGDKFIEIWISN